jgi:hypothetical protein
VTRSHSSIGSARSARHRRASHAAASSGATGPS